MATISGFCLLAKFENHYIAYVKFRGAIERDAAFAEIGTYSFAGLVHQHSIAHNPQWNFEGDAFAAPTIKGGRQPWDLAGLRMWNVFHAAQCGGRLDRQHLKNAIGRQALNLNAAISARSEGASSKTSALRLAPSVQCDLNNRLFMPH